MIYTVKDFSARITRVDVMNEGGRENKLDISTGSEKTKIEEPNWGKTAQGVSYVLEDTSGALEVHVRCQGKGNLIIRLRGVDVRGTDGRRVPCWVTYTSVKVNGSERLVQRVDACHDKSEVLLLPVSDQEELDISIRWHPRMEIIPGEVPTVKQAGDVHKCVDWFERGARSVYLVDAAGRYGWLALQRRSSSFVANGQELRLQYVNTCPVVLERSENFLADENYRHLALDRAGELALVNGAEEYPIIASDGRILAVASLYDGKGNETESLDWEIFDHVPHGMPTGKIYVVSESDPLLAEFVEYWQGILDIEALSPERMVSFFTGKLEGTLVCHHNIYGKVCSSVGIQELYDAYHRSRINIFTSCGPGIVHLLAPQLHNYATVLHDKQITFYLLHYEIPDAEIEKLRKQADCYDNLSFAAVRLTDEDYEQIVELTEYSTWPKAGIATFFKIVAWKYLPDDMERAIFLDAADVVLLDQIDDFYFADFEGKSLIVSQELNSGPGINMKDKTVRRRVLRGMFNAGVVVFNLEKIRKQAPGISAYKDFCQGLSELDTEPKNEFLPAVDQSLLSGFYFGDIKVFGLGDSQYNYFLRAFSWLIKRPWVIPKIVHFNGGGIKPWSRKYPIYIPEFQESKDKLQSLDTIDIRQHGWYFTWHEYALLASRIRRKILGDNDEEQ